VRTAVAVPEAVRETAAQDAHAPQAELITETMKGLVFRVDELAAELAVLTIGKAVTKRPHATTRPVAGLHNRDARPGPLELTGGREAREPGPRNDDSFRVHGSARAR
jgi:hypothetical protein